MSSTLSPSGVRKPAKGDTGATFFDDLADLAQKFNDHQHTGADSEILSATAFQSEQVAVLVGDWSTVGEFKEVTISLPTPMQYDYCSITPRLTSTGEQLFLKVEKASVTTAKITSSEALGLTVIVGI